MSIADLIVIGVVAAFLGFIVWASVQHRKETLRERKAAMARDLEARTKGRSRRA